MFGTGRGGERPAVQPLSGSHSPQPVSQLTRQGLLLFQHQGICTKSLGQKHDWRHVLNLPGFDCHGGAGAAEGHPFPRGPARPSLLLPKRKSEVDGLSSFRKAASIAWLKEFWKLGTGTRSELSLSASLSPGAGGARLWFSSGTGTAELSLLGSPLGMEPARHPSAGSYPVEPPTTTTTTKGFPPAHLSSLERPS